MEGGCSAPSPWLTRMKIGVEAAKGLDFLYEEDKPVIFRDFKAANILLTPDYIAKLSDFGLARDGSGNDKTHISTQNILGTKGYVAPEYMMPAGRTNLNHSRLRCSGQVLHLKALSLSIFSDVPEYQASFPFSGWKLKMRKGSQFHQIDQF